MKNKLNLFINGKYWEEEYIKNFLFQNFQINKFDDYEKFKQAQEENKIFIYTNGQKKINISLLNELKNSSSDLIFTLSDDLYTNKKYYNNFRIIFRNYFFPKLASNNVYTLPLGFGNVYVNSEKKFDFTNKEYMWSFIGRGDDYRKSVIDKFIHIEPYILELNDKFLDIESRDINLQKEKISKSFFLLCPGSYNPESFRIMEALELGTLPILISQFNSEYFKYIYGDHPLIIINKWSDISLKVTKLIEDPELLKDKLLETEEWYSKFKNNLLHDIETIVLNKNTPLKSEQFAFQRKAKFNLISRFMYFKFFPAFN